MLDQAVAIQDGSRGTRSNQDEEEVRVGTRYHQQDQGHDAARDRHQYARAQPKAGYLGEYGLYLP
jgi:phage protein D